MIDKIMDLILRAPEKWVHIREIARKVGISPNSVRKYATKLRKKGLIEMKKESNMVMMRASMENQSYKQEKLVHNLRSIFSSGLADFLYQYCNPRAIVLFGTYSRGEDISTSDVDIGIITNSKKRPDLSKFEKKLARRIELSLFTRKEVSDEFFNNIINGIVLKGVLKNE